MTFGVLVDLPKLPWSQINEFYLQKEAELKLRLETLLSKRRAAAMRGFPDTVDDTTQNNVEWSAVEEGFRHLERDLGKLQVYTLQSSVWLMQIIFPAICGNQRNRLPEDPEKV
jgi:hypothetical protein